MRFLGDDLWKVPSEGIDYQLVILGKPSKQLGFDLRHGFLVLLSDWSVKVALQANRPLCELDKHRTELGADLSKQSDLDCKKDLMLTVSHALKTYRIAQIVTRSNDIDVKTRKGEKVKKFRLSLEVMSESVALDALVAALGETSPSLASWTKGSRGRSGIPAPQSLWRRDLGD